MNRPTKDLKVIFLLRKVFRGNLNKAISTNEIASFKFPRKVFRGNLNKAISTNEIASFKFPRKIFLKRKLTIRIIKSVHPE